MKFLSPKIPSEAFRHKFNHNKFAITHTTNIQMAKLEKHLKNTVIPCQNLPIQTLQPGQETPGHLTLEVPSHNTDMIHLVVSLIAVETRCLAILESDSEKNVTMK